VRAAWPEVDVPSSEGMGIVAWLGTIAEERKVDVFVLLDQFEEYFLYHSEETAVVRLSHASWRPPSRRVACR
jgi:hypothetical protein